MIPARLAFAPDVVLQVISGEAVLLKLNDEQFFALNETGTRVAQLIASGHPTSTILEILKREYPEATGSIETDVTSLIEELMAKRLLSTDSVE